MRRSAFAAGVIVSAMALLAITGCAGPMSAEEAKTISVGQTIEHGEITVGLENIRISKDATVLEAWYDAGTLADGDVGPMAAHSNRFAELVVNGEEILRGDGGVGFGCGEVGKLIFGPLPEDARELAWEWGPFWASDPLPLELSLPVGPYLQQVADIWDSLDRGEPAPDTWPSGGSPGELGESIQIPLDIEAEVEGRIYRFTLMSVGQDSFTLDYVPANEEASWHPLLGPLTKIVVRDDRGHVYKQCSSYTEWDKQKGFSLKEAGHSFKGEVDLEASMWVLEMEGSGVIYRGPWRFQVSLQ